MKTQSRMFYTLILLIGIGLAVWGIVRFQQTRSFIRTGKHTIATVIAVIPEKDSEGGTIYKPVFEYTTFDNQKLTYTPTVGSNPSDWMVGETTGLIYDANKTDSVLIVSYFGLFVWSIVLLSIAAPFIIVGGGYFFALKYLGQ